MFVFHVKPLRELVALMGLLTFGAGYLLAESGRWWLARWWALSPDLAGGMACGRIFWQLYLSDRYRAYYRAKRQCRQLVRGMTRLAERGGYDLSPDARRRAAEMARVAVGWPPQRRPPWQWRPGEPLPRTGPDYSGPMSSGASAW